MTSPECQLEEQLIGKLCDLKYEYREDTRGRAALFSTTLGTEPTPMLYATFSTLLLAQATQPAPDVRWDLLPSLGGIGAMGALVFVFLRWHELSHKLSGAKYQQMRRSPLTWGVFIGGIVASGLFTWLYHHDNPGIGIFHIALTGAAAPALANQAIATASRATGGLEAGPVEVAAGPSFSARDLFR